GVAGGKARQKTASEIFSFAEIAANATGLSRRSIELAVAMVNGLSADTRQRVRGTDIERKASDLRALASVRPELQAQALDLLLSSPPQAGSVGDAILLAQGLRPADPKENAFRTFSDSWTRFEVRYRRSF